MSESRRTLLALMEQDPELRRIGPLVRVILEVPSDSLGDFVNLANLWADLASECRAILLLSLKDRVTVKEIARIVGVHPRTVLKWKRLKNARKQVRAEQAGGPPGAAFAGTKPTTLTPANRPLRAYPKKFPRK